MVSVTNDGENEEKRGETNERSEFVDWRNVGGGGA